MTKTTNYQLNQWAKPDRVMMDDFNADNAKIDAALKANADAIAAETTARVAGDALVKLKEITVTSEIAQIDMDFSDIDLRSFSKLIIRPALACTDNVDYRLRFGSGEGTIFRHYVNREFANYDYAAGLRPAGGRPMVYDSVFV